jgi:LAO/AO transport system kinase
MTPNHDPDGQVNRGWLKDLLAGDFRAVARLITLIENGSSAAIPYLREIFPHSGHAFTIGITGSPGVGKSTLVDQLAGHYRTQGIKVGIIAVDPTSPFTGGAILGDRVRMQSRSVDAGTFIRSMATRGHLGGVSRATADARLVLDAAGFEIILIETVGVGQDEVEIARSADATVVMLVPGMGDDIQAMKAGIMEIADIFVINKADRPGVERVETELHALLSIHDRSDLWKPEVVRTVASTGHGIESCAGGIGRFRKFLQNSDFRRHRSFELQKERLLELIQAKFLSALEHETGMSARIEELARRIADREIDPYTAAESLLRETESHKLMREE